LLFGGYWGLRGNISELKTQTRELEQRLAVAEEKLKAPAARASQAPFTVEPIQLGRPQQPAQPADKGAPTASVATAQAPTKSVAEAVADTVVCVDKNTHALVPCERAASCLGLKSFDTAYFNGLRTKLGISSPMMICNMKATEGEAPPPADGVGQ
jgi:hypothetical protein